ncbi:hypothetical protein ACOMHN_028753 [Nucella lapillus]
MGDPDVASLQSHRLQYFKTRELCLRPGLSLKRVVALWYELSARASPWTIADVGGGFGGDVQVSRGAECIMLSREFFCKHATEMGKKKVQELVRPYPDEVTFQESLQRKANWDLFKHTLIEDITSLPVR